MKTGFFKKYADRVPFTEGMRLSVHTGAFIVGGKLVFTRQVLPMFGAIETIRTGDTPRNSPSYPNHGPYFLKMYERECLMTRTWRDANPYPTKWDQWGRLDSKQEDVKT